MNEQIIQLAWQLQLFEQQSMRLSDGSQLTIIDPGQLNHNSGPDFLFGKIRIDDLLLVGNIEIHINSSDWDKHRHTDDPAYNSVILHVVFCDDKEIKTQAGFTLPTFVLQQRLPDDKLAICQELLGSLDLIPCSKHAHQIDKSQWRDWLSHVFKERVQQKIIEQEAILHSNQNDWENLCFQLLARGFGLHVNRDVFHLLAQTIPWKLLQKHRNDPFQIEALIFGQAGLLQGSFHEMYPRNLQKEYLHLKKAYKLQPLQVGIWRFSRMRPNSFPGVKIAQLANILSLKSNLVSEILQMQTTSDLKSFLNWDLPEYWKSHYHFEKNGKHHARIISQGFVDHMIINFVVPFWMVYAKNTGRQEFADLAFKWIEFLPPEDNKVIRKWKTINIEPENAKESQALIQLKQTYCDLKACVRCDIGRKIIQSATED